MSVKNICQGMLLAGIESAANISLLPYCRNFITGSWRYGKAIDKSERIAEICAACEKRNRRARCACSHAREYNKCQLLQNLV